MYTGISSHAVKHQGHDADLSPQPSKELIREALSLLRRIISWRAQEELQLHVASRRSLQLQQSRRNHPGRRCYVHRSETKQLPPPSAVKLYLAIPLTPTRRGNYAYQTVVN